MNIYIGNLARQTSEDELKATFSSFGEVTSSVIIKDKFTGESRGFGFVEMPSAADAQAAIEGLNETELGGRTITVNEAKPREDRRSGGGMGMGGGGHRGGGARRGPGGGGRGPGGGDRDRRGGGGRPGGSGGPRGGGNRY